MNVTVPLEDPRYQRALGDDLVLRWSTADDVELLASLYGQVYRDAPDAPLTDPAVTRTRDLMSGRHPLIGPTDFAVVERVGDRAIVAATCLYRQVWTYTDIIIPLGRPEYVATLVGYRNRGLIRAIFQLIHARSAARGDLAQCITGIAYYYRQFGYEYALDLDPAHSLPISAIPRLEQGKVEQFRLRDATLADLPALAQLYDRDRAYALLSTRIDSSYWRWILGGTDHELGAPWRVAMIFDAAERVRGYVIASRRAAREGFYVNAIGVASGTSLNDVLPSVLRALADVSAIAPRRPNAEQPTTLLFEMGRGHRVYEALGDLLPPAPRRPYCWYVRVPDVPAFLRHITPLLESRLSDSIVSGYSGELKIDLYRGGLRLILQHGRLDGVEAWQRGPWETAHAGCPPLVFLQLLCGYRDLDDLRGFFSDVWADKAVVPLLRTLFPEQPSWVMPLD